VGAKAAARGAIAKPVAKIQHPLATVFARLHSDAARKSRVFFGLDVWKTPVSIDNSAFDGGEMIVQNVAVARVAQG
jgi:hypothetical protein